VGRNDNIKYLLVPADRGRAAAGLLEHGCRTESLEVIPRLSGSMTGSGTVGRARVEHLSAPTSGFSPTAPLERQLHHDAVTARTSARVSPLAPVAAPGPQMPSPSVGTLQKPFPDITPSCDDVAGWKRLFWDEVHSVYGPYQGRARLWMCLLCQDVAKGFPPGFCSQVHTGFPMPPTMQWELCIDGLCGGPDFWGYGGGGGSGWSGGGPLSGGGSNAGPSPMVYCPGNKKIYHCCSSDKKTEDPSRCKYGWCGYHCKYKMA